MDQKSPIDKLIDDMRAGLLKSNPEEERKFGFRAKLVRERLRELILDIAKSCGLVPIGASPFKKGCCILGRASDSRFVHVEVSTFNGVWVAASFLYGKSYGKFPDRLYDVDDDVPSCPKNKYFLLNAEQLGVDHEYDLSVWLRDNPEFPPFEDRLLRIDRIMREYSENVMRICFECLSSIEPRGYGAG